MQFKRDYSRPLFGPRKPQRNYGRVLFFFGMLIGSLVVYVAANFESVQSTALDVVGLAPTATPLPSDLATVGSELVLAGDYEEAAELFETALAQRPDDIGYLHEYGQLMIEMDAYDRAIEIADQIIEIDPADPRGYGLKARAWVWSGNPTSAIPVALSGIDLAPEYVPLYAALARAYTDTGQYQDGVETGLIATEISPDDVDARRSYAHTLTWVQQTDEAIRQLEIAMMIDPNNIDTHFELAFLYLAQNRDQEAIDLYDRVLALRPRNALAKLRLCEAYRKVGQFERAVGYCQDATNDDPTLTSAFYQLGLLLYNRYEYEGARDAFASCSQQVPDNLDCKYRLGLAYHYVGDCDAAWDTLQDSLLMAQGRSQTERVLRAVENIRLGLVAVGEQCPQYGGAETTPEITAEPQDVEDNPPRPTEQRREV